MATAVRADRAPKPRSTTVGHTRLGPRTRARTVRAALGAAPLALAPSALAPRPAAAQTDVTTRTRDGVRLARDYLHAHVTEPVGLAELARVAGVSKFALLRAFGRDVGVPPHAYLTRLRLVLARHLIDRGEPLSHVAFDVGFADQSHLTRRFKGLFGTTPGAYARSRDAGRPRSAPHEPIA